MVAFVVTLEFSLIGSSRRMTTQFLRDDKGRTIATITSKQSGVLEIRNAKGQCLGTYDSKRNITIDSKGRSIGTGNLLTTLLT